MDARHALGALVLLFLSIPTPAAETNPAGARLFLDSCAACHSIGEGDLVGPDLIRAARTPRSDVENAVRRMQENTGPLTPEQITALVDLLQSADAKDRIAAAANPPAAAVIPEEQAASAATGRELFFGHQPFANRGMPCMACHSLAGRGGDLAVDLTNVHARREKTALAAAAQQPAFPLMKAAYRGHAVTAQEAWHLAAFLHEAPAAPRERPQRIHAIAGAIAFGVLAGVALMSRSRRSGVRSRMVRKSSGGE